MKVEMMYYTQPKIQEEGRQRQRKSQRRQGKSGRHQYQLHLRGLRYYNIVLNITPIGLGVHTVSGARGAKTGTGARHRKTNTKGYQNWLRIFFYRRKEA